jgi:hypothetical protein
MTTKNASDLPGKILLIGPSRAGKSFLAGAFRDRGLNVVDADGETDLIRWTDDETGLPVENKPATPSHEWFATHHFLMDKPALQDFLSARADIIFLAHCWNIMECINLFDEVYLMYVPMGELERRMKNHRDDHQWQGSAAEVDFMLARHRERQAQAQELGIPFLDSTGGASEVLDRLIKLHLASVNTKSN